MGYIKSFSMDENGAGWGELTEDEKLDVELALMTNQVQVACVICFQIIPAGTGNTCETHRGQKPSW